jgi:hypothetical protein
VSADDAADRRDAVHLDEWPLVDHQAGDIGRRRQQEVRHLEGAGQDLPEDNQHNDEQDRAGALDAAARQLRAVGWF